MSGNPFESSPTLNASSAVRKAGMSITLPRNFAPLSLDVSEAPRTPDQALVLPELPPPPPHSAYRVRRPRLTMQNFQSRGNTLPVNLFASDIPIPSSAGPFTTEFSKFLDFSPDDPIPSLEIPSSEARPRFSHTISEPCSSSRLQLHTPTYEPRTPPAQTTATPVNDSKSTWDLPRPASVCSHRSDSSLSTTKTFETRPTSFDGSVTSPEDEKDPFSPPENIKIIPATPSRKSKKLRLSSILSKDKANWTTDMDNHLFNIYQMYLQDPTVTPFKTLPGSIPPTGVCHRVARRAKETWPRASRIDVPIIKRYRIRNLREAQLQARDTTPDRDNFLSTDSISRRSAWPSESSTRKRLKQLCREKFYIGKYYDRMRESRSPSPFAEQFVPRKSRLSRSPSYAGEEQDVNATYATRELGISLVASGATEPLAQLVTGDSPPSVPHILEDFNTAIDATEDMVVSPAPATGLGINHEADKLAPASTIPRLASPFTYNTWDGHGRNDKHQRRPVSSHHFGTMHATGPRLLSPFQADMSLNVNKRRAQHTLEDELSPNGSSLAGHTSGLKLDEPSPVMSVVEPQEQELVFSGFGDFNQRRVRLRNRGATLGTAHERIERLFTPPSQLPDIPAVPAIPRQFAAEASQGSSLMPPKVDEGQRRLGSPFELDPNKRSIRMRAPRHLPSLSDPFIQFTHGIPTTSTANPNNNNIGNISERLASFTQTLNEHRQEM